MQADLAYAYEHITRDYPDAAGANQGKKISTVSDYFRNIRTRSVHPRLAFGYDFGGWRIAADYARYRKWHNNKYSVNIKELERNDNASLPSGKRHLNIKTQKTEHR
ncbi:Opacity protein opA54, partial [Neisseria gonorrhoeae]